MKKLFKRFTAILTIISLSCAIISSSAIVSDAAEETAKNEQYATACFAAEQIHCTFDMDVNQMQIYENAVIPLEFDLYGIGAGETLQPVVTGDVMFTHDVLDATAYTMQNNHASISIEITEEPTEQTLDNYLIKHIQIDFMNQSGVSCYSIDMSLLNTQYGVFVSYINDECLVDAFAKWLHDNQYISAIAYDQYVADKHRADVTIVPKGATTFSTMATSSTLADTMYTSINITATNSGASLTISGYVYWRDSNGNSHPARGVTVNIYDRNTTGYGFFTICTANGNGYFSRTITNDLSASENGGYDISIQINAETQYATLTNVTAVIEPYYFVVDCGDDINSSISIYSTYNNSQNNCRAFQILDATYTGGLFVRAMTGYNLDSVVIQYPYAGPLTSHYNYFYDHIHLKDDTYGSWDTILHEYGHYVAEMYGIFPGIIMNHTLESNAIVYASMNLTGDELYLNHKLACCQLAWQEGWATYFSIAAQVQQNTELMGMDGVGNLSFSGFLIEQDKKWDDDEQSYVSFSGRGEASELAVARVLWDLTDTSTILGVSDDDVISWGYYVVWDYTVESDADTFSDFMNYIETCAPYSANATYVSQILEKEQISANLQYPTISSTEARLNWSPAYEDGTYVDNNYYIDVYNSNKVLIYTTRVFSSPGVISGSTWTELCSNNPNGLYLCIRTVPYDNVPGYDYTYASGPYYSELVFYNP